MFSRSICCFSLPAIVLTVLCSGSAEAGNAREEFHPARHHHSKTYSTARHRYHATRQVDTYSGDVAIYSSPHVGQWSYGSVSIPQNTTADTHSARIIDVDALGRNAECSMEMGVCVIRP